VGLVIASVLSDRPIRHDVAMTGEVSLRGRVLVVGGLREKALASYRAGFRAMLFPAANVKDIDDIPPDVRAALELIPVSTMDEVFAVALHKVIKPRVGNHYVIEIEEEEAPGWWPARPRSARGPDREGGRSASALHGPSTSSSARPPPRAPRRRRAQGAPPRSPPGSAPLVDQSRRTVP
jgi:hypothetical protein